MRVAVVGSGPSGVAAASVLLAAGHRVELLDVGRAPEPEAEKLAQRLRDRIGSGQPPGAELRTPLRRGFGEGRPRGLGGALLALARPGIQAERGLKKSWGSDFVFSGVERGIPVEGAVVPRSLARGGLSNVWGAACYPLRAADYADWPLPAADLDPYYAPAVELLGVVQSRDDLARAYPLHGEIQPPAARNPGSAAERLLARWRRLPEPLAAHGLAAGRARLAVRRAGMEGDDCRSCGLCFYGCPFTSIYSGRRSLAELVGQEGLVYRPGRLVVDFREEGERVRVRARDDASGALEEQRYDVLLLAAGVLSSLRIAADSLGLHDRTVPLLDNNTYLLPAVLTRHRVPGRFRTSFTLGEAVLAVEPGVVADRGLHLQLYSFHDYFLQETGELLEKLPGPVQRAAWAVLNNLLVAFVYLPSRDSARASARVRRGDDLGRVAIEASPNPASRAILRRLFRQLWSARSSLGLLALTPLMKQAPLGFGGHLAGTLPMRARPGPLETDREGRLSGTRRVYVVDAAALPALPAQNLTLTLVANAMRVADGLNRRGG